MILPIALFVWVVGFTHLPPILMGTFETEKECYVFGGKLQESTRAPLEMQCHTDT